MRKLGLFAVLLAVAALFVVTSPVDSASTQSGVCPCCGDPWDFRSTTESEQ